MKRLFAILSFFMFTLVASAQEEMRVIDSLEGVMANQEGREKVETMIELSKAFFGFSFDDCIDWGEKAIREANNLELVELEADITYNLGVFYGDHADNDLAQNYLRKAYLTHTSVGNGKKALNDLWMQAYYELVIGNIDTAYTIYEKVIEIVDVVDDSLMMAKAMENMAIIQYQLQNFNQAEVGLKKSRSIYDSLKDTLMVMKVDLNLACLYMECGNISKAKNLFLDVIPKFEANCNYGLLILAYKNYGQLFVKDCYNYDSASYYYEKAYSIVELLESYGIDIDANDKVNLLVEMGNALYNNDNYKDAEDWYIKAFELAKSSSNASGQMLACVGLGLVYSYLSQPSKSLYYLNLIDELESKSGISIAYSTIKFPLILNYARLGKYDAMESELKDFKEQYDGLIRKNNDLYDQLSTIQEDYAGLLPQYEAQNHQIQTLQSQRNHYRLAFFGLLAIMLFIVVLLVSRKIVRKKRAKIEKG